MTTMLRFGENEMLNCVGLLVFGNDPNDVTTYPDWYRVTDPSEILHVLEGADYNVKTSKEDDIDVLTERNGRTYRTPLFELKGRTLLINGQIQFRVPL